MLSILKILLESYKIIILTLGNIYKKFIEKLKTQIDFVNIIYNYNFHSNKPKYF